MRIKQEQSKWQEVIGTAGVLVYFYLIILSGCQDDQSPHKAAEQENADAQNKLGLMYYHGEGVTQDYTQAVLMFRKAAEQEHAESQFNLGTMYYNGEGVQKDHTQAVKWLRKAARQGLKEAQQALNNLGESP
ncbi:MAG: sel1 repeat family protein [Planctomycetes bacterium]|nr:sel1 repeat family protein [Planctomycetota bacterium]MCH9724981.1 sel1 repeat family protein [Planctomycetota bacterium]MCH9777558.1 sel1 repeat family protein [Planctomycetota bacterium]MCH9790780.1 sel1 repeat family protein [Planctomycetota bacterium]